MKVELVSKQNVLDSVWYPAYRYRVTGGGNLDFIRNAFETRETLFFKIGGLTLTSVKNREYEGHRIGISPTFLSPPIQNYITLIGEIVRVDQHYVARPIRATILYYPGGESQLQLHIR